MNPDTTASAANTPQEPDVDRLRLDLEERRFAFEKRFSAKFGGILVTAAVSLAAVVVSATQVVLSRADDRRSGVLRAAERAEDQARTDAQHDREWRLAALQFVYDRHDLILNGT